MKEPSRRPSKALVTGGGGFLGQAVVRRLLARGDAVRSFSRGDYPELRGLGVEVIRGDLSDKQSVIDACRGCDIVFHIAAKAGIWGPADTYYRTNVLGTENVITACRNNGIQRLVYTSSPSVIFDGRDMEGVDETVPQAARYHADYPRTKAIAERKVLAANGPDLATVALRPHLIWGPGDNHLVPQILRQARSLRRIGRQDKMVDSVYIDNAADAHLLAADRLEITAPITGKAYFITNGEPRGVWQLINGILAAADLPPITRHIPKPLASGLAAIMEATYKLFRLRSEPRLTRFLVRELTTAHWFDITAARRDLNYSPRISIDEGLKRLRNSLQ